jgi:hypothetical protein
VNAYKPLNMIKIPECHDITEILLKVALYPQNLSSRKFVGIQVYKDENTRIYVYVQTWVTKITLRINNII